jgi:ribose-phosphate pyrophosphokinase
MILFAFPQYQKIAHALTQLPTLERGSFSTERFPNQEILVKVLSPVKGQDCLLLGWLKPPEENLFSFLLLGNTLKKEGARKVVALIPYLSYSRQDKDEPGESFTTAWLGQLLKASGTDKVITVDLHSPLAKPLFPIPLVSLSPASVFAREIVKRELTKATLVAPDEGALEKTRLIGRESGIQKPLVYFEKTRTDQKIKLVFRGKAGKQALIVDDILDTGKTLLGVCENLANVGVEEIYIFATHALFTGKAWEKLWALGVKQILTTDTIPPQFQPTSEKIQILSVIPLLEEVAVLESSKRDSF